MNNGDVIEQIGVTVSKSVLAKVSRFSNGTDPDVMHELLQNARRAGATRVHVTIADGFMTIADDGVGISKPASLLGFGESDWSDATVQDEDPAGIGVFSLARRAATVTSRTEGGQPWTVDLNPEHFAGRAEAEVRAVDAAEIERGTRIRFELESVNLRTSAVEAVAKYYPVPVSVNGEAVKQRSFLANAVWREEWNGVEIGVVRSGGLSREESLNFYGVVVGGAGLPAVTTEDGGWVALVDVQRAPDLELVLPARKEVVEAPFVAELRGVCRVAIFKALANLDPPERVSAKLRDEALAAGVELPPAEATLRPWRPDEADWVGNMNRSVTRHAEVADDAFVVDLQVTAAEEQALWRAAETAEISDRLFTRDPAMEGYAWYDGLTRLTAIEAVVTIDGEEAVFTSEHGSPGADRPERIELRVETRGRGANGQMALPTDLAVPGSPDSAVVDWVNEIEVAIARDSTLTVPELADFFESAYFSTSDDSDADSRDSQLDSFQIGAIARAARYLESDDTALARVVEEAIRRHVSLHVSFKRFALVRIGPGWKIRVHVGEGDEERGLPAEESLHEDAHRAGHIGAFITDCVPCEMERHADAIRRASSPALLRSAGLPEPDEVRTVVVEERVVRRARVRVRAYDGDTAERVVRERADRGDRSIQWELDGDNGYEVSAFAIQEE